MRRFKIKRFKVKLSLSDKVVVGLSYATVFILLLLLLGSSIRLPVALSVAVGGSMYPTIRSGDMNILVSTSTSPIKPGDIAVYERNGIYVIHRVEKIENGTVIFKGDNNVNNDLPVPIEYVKYKVVATIPSTIWAPTISILLVVSAFAPQVYLRRKYGEGYTIHTMAILAFFIIMVTTLSSAVFIDKGYSVKPSPVPKIETVTKIDDNHFLVKFNFDPVNVNCKNAVCSIVAPRTVKVSVTGKGSVWIYAELPTEFKTVAVFVVSTS